MGLSELVRVSHVASPPPSVFYPVDAKFVPTDRVTTPVERKAAWDVIREVELRHPVFGVVHTEWCSGVRAASDVEVIWLKIEARVIERDTPPGGPEAFYDPLRDRIAPSPNVATVRMTRDLHIPQCLSVWRLEGFEAAVHAVARSTREAVLDFLAHELDEQLFASGRRIFDPHVQRWALTPPSTNRERSTP